jgi:peptide-methionine (S)-S-oxide reductase
MSEKREVATLAGGCFWCVEAVFQDLKGVEKVVSGYSGGSAANPSYEEVSTGTTGHAESLQITFDPETIPYRDILYIFFRTHDPTTLNRQGPDVGTQYRSAIFYHTDEQRQTAEAVKRETDSARIWPAPIVTEIVPFKNFFKAEDYHQNYFKNNPNQMYCQLVINPKIRKFRHEFAERLKSPAAEK